MIEHEKCFVEFQQELFDDMNRQIDDMKKKYYLGNRGKSSTGAKV